MATPTAAAELAVSRSREPRVLTYPFALVVLTSLFFMGLSHVWNDIMIPASRGFHQLHAGDACAVRLLRRLFSWSRCPPALIRRVGYRTRHRHWSRGGPGVCRSSRRVMREVCELFLGAFFVLASGITILQVAAKSIRGDLGGPETVSSRLNLTQAFNSLGTTVAPLFWIDPHPFDDSQRVEFSALRRLRPRPIK